MGQWSDRVAMDASDILNLCDSPGPQSLVSSCEQIRFHARVTLGNNPVIALAFKRCVGFAATRLPSFFAALTIAYHST